MKTNKTSKTKKVLEHLQKYGSITSWQAIELYGATRLSAIIYNLREKYKISSCKINGDMITIAIDTIRMASDIEQQHRKFPPFPVQQNKLPIIDVQIFIEDLLKLTGNVSQINTEFKSGEDTFCSQIVSFHNTKSSRTYEGHFYVPKSNPDGHIEFSIKDTIWKSQQIMPSSDDIYQLRTFNIRKKSFVL